MRLYIGGTFDLFHPGHINFLRQCKRLVGEDGEVIVSLNTDEFVKKFKGKSTIMSFEERKTMLLSCRYVNDVVENIGGWDSKPAIEYVKPGIVAIGTDWATKDYYAQMDFTQEWLDERDIVLVYIPYTENISTTKIKERIRK